jgi:hypothetical protein
MKFTRRDALKTLAAAPMASRLKAGATDRSNAGSFDLQAGDPALNALADVVLPAEADRKAALAAFVAWHDGYKEGADTDHGYGNTRIRATGPGPSKNYAVQLQALDAAARAAGAASLAAAAPALRRTLVDAAVADAKVDRLPARPTGGHVATDLMGHYFNSSAANDLCYRARINRDACRGLAGSDLPPEGGSDRSIGGSDRSIK